MKSTVDIKLLSREMLEKISKGVTPTDFEILIDVITRLDKEKRVTDFIMWVATLIIILIWLWGGK
jgi:hypothetical protein